ncbi:hypothetical protein HWHPT5561_09420 [Petrotoga sp. HWH.PT.55.6.1]|jgi:hypothetical protein|nr:hypothetical protein X925_09010 [Petrotoga sp. 9T1HF07.CasAA.8.2]PNR94448.1 hypothetical protein X926_00480 [Petrotoga sp. HWHPT.55.6.3]RPD35096.1 hypothetical protein HWHPT5561_09420 [Petrotoga sp. HWH.PT.55.6.1]
MLYSIYTRGDIKIGKIREEAKKVMDETAELVISIAKKLNNKGMGKVIGDIGWSSPHSLRDKMLEKKFFILVKFLLYFLVVILIVF